MQSTNADNERLAKFMGRTPQSVAKRRCRLSAMKTVKYGTSWDGMSDSLVMSKLPDFEIARALKCSVGAVRTRRWRLKAIYDARERGGEE